MKTTALDKALEAIDRDRKADALKKAIIELKSAICPHDEKLRRIVANNSGPKLHGGMLGGLQIMANVSSPSFYKMKAAESLLNLRQLRRWHIAYRHKAFTSEADLRRAAMCRGRAAGTVPMPAVYVVGA